MKKLIMALATALLLSSASFAEIYLNFTLPASLCWHYQNGVNSSNDTGLFMGHMSVTGEVFSTMSGSFGLGVKGGYEWANSTELDYGSDSGEADFRGWYIAPTFGWANDSNGTKKKINLYPFMYENLTFSNVEGSSLTKDYEMTNYKFGAAFSFQWGASAVQNGFEFGFDFDWNSILKYDGTEIANDGNGFECWIGYKLSFIPGK